MADGYHYYCNDCGQGFLSDGYQHRCQSCLHESGDCFRRARSCSFCVVAHRDHDLADLDAYSQRYCWECEWIRSHRQDRKNLLRA
jgi:hypothetical protein